MSKSLNFKPKLSCPCSISLIHPYHAIIALNISPSLIFPTVCDDYVLTDLTLFSFLLSCSLWYLSVSAGVVQQKVLGIIPSSTAGGAQTFTTFQPRATTLNIRPNTPGSQQQVHLPTACSV